MHRATLTLLALVALCGAVGCGESSSYPTSATGQRTEPAPQPASAPDPAASRGGSTGLISGPQSALGKARDQGFKTRDRVDEYNRKIEQAADGVGKEE